jgi:fused signal recognition particle receptor
MLSFLKSKFSKKSLKALTLSIGNKIKDLFLQKKEDPQFFEELEKLFFEADLGVTTSIALVNKVKEALKKQAIDPIEIIKAELSSLLIEPKDEKWQTTPHVILCVGVNGSGKTTTIAKLANQYKEAGKSVLLAAADTYRAAAVEQLEVWAERIGVNIVKGQLKSDPASVAFDAVTASLARKSDVVLIDTAGRLQNKKDLMQELGKISKVCGKVVTGAPHETLLILDATIGQNAIDQAKTFNDFTPINGLILTKVDSTAKGGIVIAISQELKIPVKWIGIGEKLDDLIPFDKENFINELLSTNK